MAQIIKKNNDLLNKYRQYKRITLIGYGVCAIFFIAFALNMFSFNFGLSIPLMLGFVLGGFVGGMFKQKAEAVKSGLDGEMATAAIVSSLPETYCGFQNIKITFDGKQSELDMVVTGPTGVFIIETKNMNGAIVGNYDNPQWTQKKVGQQGTPYSKNFYNPIKQVGTHVYRLANYLRNNGVNIHVSDMVYFSNPDTFVQLIGIPTKTPVFTALGNGATEICNHILNGEQEISKEDLSKINALLNS